MFGFEPTKCSTCASTYKIRFEDNCFVFSCENCGQFIKLEEKEHKTGKIKLDEPNDKHS